MKTIRKRKPRKEAVLYCRVSGWPQCTNGSLGTQLRDGLEYSKRNRIDVVAAFSDVGSASDCDSQLMGREQALKVCRRRGATLLIQDYGRLTRTSKWTLNSDIEVIIFNGLTMSMLQDAIFKGDINGNY
tara:strand:- start:1823 stop:2209 length:387 start_codon:yes stop_codon:yes gene_type:complete